MQMTVNIAGQANQITLGKNQALWPLFETVVNSIQSLEDTFTDKKNITIEAVRMPSQIHVTANGDQIDELTRFVKFVVRDNGNGFNTKNYNSFYRLILN